MLHSKNYLSGRYSHIGGGKFLLGHGLAHDTIWPTNTFAQSKKKKIYHTGSHGLQDYNPTDMLVGRGL